MANVIPNGCNQEAIYVPAPDPCSGGCVLETLNVTEDGTYTPPSGVDGFDNVIVETGGGSNVIWSNDKTLAAYIDQDNSRITWYFMGFTKAANDVAIPQEMIIAQTGLLYSKAYGSDKETQIGNIGFYNGNIRSWNMDTTQTLAGTFWGVVYSNGGQTQANPYSEPPKGGGAKNILGGTAVPTSAEGSDGDIYIMYTDYSGASFPSGYTGLEYIQGNNSATINTGFVPTVNTKAEIKMNPQSVNTSAVLGSDWDLNGFFLMFYNSKFRWHTASSVDVPASGGVDYDVIVDNTGISVNGSKYNTTPSTSVSSSPISLFTTTVDSQGAKGSYKLYRFKVWDNDVLERNMIPVKRNSDDVLGLYDLVNDVFYTNSGTGSFTGGPEASGKPIDTAYLKVNGSWIILEDGDWDDVNTGA